ncbi:MAG: hypothetical protein V3581_02100 [Candidatus Cardinium sp.]
MHHTIGLRRDLIAICRSGWIFYLVLGIACEGGRCTNYHHERKQPSASDLQMASIPQVLCKQPHTPPQCHKRKNIDIENLNDVDDLASPIKKIKRIPKVEEGKQVIVCLHGLTRVSSDFDTMKAILQQKFPHVPILALERLNKDFTHSDKSCNLTVKYSIKAQASVAYEEIKTKVPRGSEIILVTHSQGGLRGFALLKEYMNRLENECGIVVHQLITIATPWKGAPVFGHIKDVKHFNQTFDRIVPILERIRQGYSEFVRGYFFKKAPGIAKNHPAVYQLLAPWASKFKNVEGMTDLDPASDFMRCYVPLGLKDMEVPITAIATVLIDFSQLFDSFESPVRAQELAELNATYAALIGGDPKCEHDMLLPVATQHAEGLVTKNFKRIKVYGACHGNKVGITVKRGLSALNNAKVIQKVAESIEEVFYEHKEEADIAQAPSEVATR